MEPALLGLSALLAGTDLCVDLPLISRAVTLIGSAVTIIGHSVTFGSSLALLGNLGVSPALAVGFSGFPEICGDLSLVGCPLSLIGQTLSHLLFDLAVVGNPVPLVSNPVPLVSNPVPIVVHRVAVAAWRFRRARGHTHTFAPGLQVRGGGESSGYGT